MSAPELHFMFALLWKVASGLWPGALAAVVALLTIGPLARWIGRRPRNRHVYRFRAHKERPLFWPWNGKP